MKKNPNRLSVSSLFIATLCVAALALVATLPGGGWWFGAQVPALATLLLLPRRLASTRARMR